MIAHLTASFARWCEARWVFIVAAVFFRVALEVAYSSFVVRVFEYDGFILDFSGIKYAETWLLYFVFLVIFPAKLHRPSDYLMAFMLFSVVVPMLVFYSLSNASRAHLYIFLLGAALVFCARAGRPLRIPYVRGGRTVASAVIGFGALGVTSWMLLSGGFQFFNLDLARVYEFRSDAGDVINQGPMGYLNVWASKVFGPILLALSLWQRKLWLSAAVLGLHIFWFGVSSHKSVLFYPVLVTFLWVWFERSRALSLIPIGMTVVVTVSVCAFLLSSEVFLGSLFVRRVFFVPASLTFTYYEFFSINELVLWSNSIASPFLDYPYHENTAKVIGDYLGHGAHANNSFFATGYMHAGVLGVAFYGTLVGFLFRLIDSLAYKSIPAWVGVACVIVPAQALMTSADLPTGLLTHGMGIAVILLFLLRSPNALTEREAASARK